jgi:hypothetical protein
VDPPGQRAGAPRLRYRDVRDRIETGDLLLYRGTGVISALIRWGSRSEYSHCGVAAWWGHRLLVFQAARRGVEVLPASRAVWQYAGRVDWWSVRPALRPHLDRPRLLDECVAALGTPFGFGALAVYAGRTVLDRLEGDDDERDPTAMFCSWYVSRCFRQAGLNLCHIKPDDCTSPGHIARSGAVIFRGVLHDGTVRGDEPLPPGDDG